MRRGEIYRTAAPTAERGHKPGFYVVVSRDFVARLDDLATVICAPVYGEVLGLSTELLLGPEEGLPKVSAVRCDFLTLMFKRKLTDFVSRLQDEKIAELDRALATALDLPLPKREGDRL